MGGIVRLTCMLPFLLLALVGTLIYIVIWASFNVKPKRKLETMTDDLIDAVERADPSSTKAKEEWTNDLILILLVFLILIIIFFVVVIVVLLLAESASGFDDDVFSYGPSTSSQQSRRGHLRMDMNVSLNVKALQQKKSKRPGRPLL